MLGADWSERQWAAGAMLAYSHGEGTYQDESDDGTVESTLTGVYPYGRVSLNDRVSAWGVTGYGSGTLKLTPGGQQTIDTDMDLVMANVGLRGIVRPAPAEGGAELAVKTDALGVRTTSDAAPGELSAATANVTRLRLGAESTWSALELAGGTVALRLETGVRHDGGDAETGFGIDVGGAIGWRNAASGLSVELQGRGLLTHESDGFSDRAMAGSITYDPRPKSERGLTLTLRQSMGGSATGGMDALLGRETLAGLAGDASADELSRQRVEMRVGYGMPAFRGRATATPEFGVGLDGDNRDMSVGVRFGLIGEASEAVEMGIEATRRDSADEAGPEHGIAVRLNARF